MNIRLGYQTIQWGLAPNNYDEILRAISSAGYTGIEIGQHPRFLPHPRELASMLRHYGLQLLGLANGSPFERRTYCGDILQPHYFYVESCTDSLYSQRQTFQAPLALHAHVFKETESLADAEELLRRFPDLSWIPDTAHLHIVGENFTKAALLVPSGRLAAIHLKDWTSLYGRSCHRYARGFVNLGSGEVDLKACLTTLRNLKLKKPLWIVVEQDRTSFTHEETLSRNSHWLTRQNFNLQFTERSKYNTTPLRQPGSSLSSNRKHVFARELTEHATKGVSRFFDGLAESLGGLIESHLVTVWACSPAVPFLTLRGHWPKQTKLRTAYLDSATTPSSVALRNQYIEQFKDIRQLPDKLQFGDSDLANSLGLKAMVSLPVMSPHNHNHERLLVNIFPKQPLTQPRLRDLFLLGELISHLVETVLDEECLLAAQIAISAAQHETSFEQYLLKTIESINLVPAVD